MNLICYIIPVARVDYHAIQKKTKHSKAICSVRIVARSCAEGKSRIGEGRGGRLHLMASNEALRPWNAGQKQKRTQQHRQIRGLGSLAESKHICILMVRIIPVKKSIDIVTSQAWSQIPIYMTTAHHRSKPQKRTQQQTSLQALSFITLSPRHLRQDFWFTHSEIQPNRWEEWVG